jgi:DNA-binding Xre family transcriptional regulator
MDLNEFVAKKLEKLRAERGIVVRALCEGAGVSVSGYRKIVNCKNRNIKLSTLLKITKFYRITPGELFAEYLKNLPI